MSTVHIRPSCVRSSPLTPEEVLQQIKENLAKPDAPCEGTVSFHHALLRVPDAQAHFWSPRLTVQVEEHENGSLLRCLFGPSPAVWTLFIAIYAAVGFGGMVALIWGYSQYTLGMDATVLWLAPIAAVIGLTAWVVAWFGQRLGHDQMVILQDFLKQTVDCRIVED